MGARVWPLSSISSAPASRADTSNSLAAWKLRLCPAVIFPLKAVLPSAETVTLVAFPASIFSRSMLAASAAGAGGGELSPGAAGGCGAAFRAPPCVKVPAGRYGDNQQQNHRSRADQRDPIS